MVVVSSAVTAHAGLAGSPDVLPRRNNGSPHEVYAYHVNQMCSTSLNK